MVPPAHAGPDAAFLRAFAATANGGPVTFATFMELALFHPEVGYYRQARNRVGRGPGTDFYTASSAGTVFGELVACAAAKLVAPHGAAEFTFVEIGAEPGTSVLDGVSHGFAAVRTLRLGEPLVLSGRCVVFSNELFDAQPCHRVVWRDGAWRETGVALHDGVLTEVELPALSRAVADCGKLPAGSAEGYRLDLPLAAGALAAAIAEQPWDGLFVAFDYGKTWRALTTETPAGTVRAYTRHRQSNELLAQPGQQDLTCHICWDWIEAALVQHRFAPGRLDSQESFLVRHGQEAAARIVAHEPGHRPSERKAQLHQLLHPALQGQKFQVLHARRGW